ncbi:MAG TPA: sugar ABC transporter ATP-binding protein [Spirochaetia bacterium]|nr:sugar ABC transporter ATP-binding protein [Spirochaetia bacterium]
MSSTVGERSEYSLQVKNVVKRFPGVLALDGVDLEIRPGEVLGVIGENGAGKSTLMKILAGAYFMDTGEILLDGTSIPPESNPKERMALGLGIIYQELNYLNEMTIAENFFMGRVPVKGFLRRVDYAAMKKASRELLAIFNLDYNPLTLVKTLSVAEKQMLEILRAVSRDVKVLIMDEPTSSLNEVETERLFGCIEDLRKRGVSVIYITHKLEEVLRLADRIMVMRDGKRVGVVSKGETTSGKLVEMMVGRKIAEMYPKEQLSAGAEVLRVEHLSCGCATDISLSVHKGEILGLYGLVGSGCVETVEGLLGIRARTRGTIVLDGAEVRIDDPLAAKRLGIAYVPSDRKQEGLVLIHSLKDNVAVTKLDELGRGLKLNGRKMKRYAEAWIAKLQIRAPSANAIVESLSGGNQQKVVVAKWLLTDPKVLIMNDPTRGVDVGAKVEIYKIMEELCRGGISIIMVTAELPEAIGITDRMLVLANGRVVGEYRRSEYDQGTILHLAVKGNGNG